MIWGVVGGGVGLVVVLMVIAVIVFIFVIRPCVVRRTANRRQNRGNAIAASLPTPTSKTNPTPAKTPESLAPSNSQLHQEAANPEAVALSKPTPSEEPEDEPASPKPKKAALTPVEYEELVPIVESVLASLNRLHHIDREVLESVFARWPPRHIHDVWKLEKIILQARADESIETLNQLTAELDIGFLKNKAKYGSNDSPDEAWEYANFEGLPASACHRLFAMSYPDVFKGIEGRLDDPIIEKLSVPGLYCCLMSDAFDQEFRKKLIVELRARSVKVISQVHPDELFFSAFPMYYLAHKYKVDKDNFVEGFKKPDVKKSTKFGL